VKYRKIEKSLELSDCVHFSLSFPSRWRVFLNLPLVFASVPQQRFLYVSENEMSFTVGGIRSRTGSGNQTKLDSRVSSVPTKQMNLYVKSFRRQSSMYGAGN